MQQSGSLVRIECLRKFSLAFEQLPEIDPGPGVSRVDIDGMLETGECLQRIDGYQQGTETVPGRTVVGRRLGGTSEQFESILDTASFLCKVAEIVESANVIWMLLEAAVIPLGRLLGLLLLFVHVADGDRIDTVTFDQCSIGYGDRMDSHQ